MLGALGAIGGTTGALEALGRALPPGRLWESLPHFNDSRRSVRSILALFDRAIAAEEQAP